MAVEHNKKPIEVIIYLNILHYGIIYGMFEFSGL